MGALPKQGPPAVNQSLENGSLVSCKTHIRHLLSEILMLIDLIKRQEGLSLKLYHDTLGFASIGYGRCIDKVGISQDEAEYLLRSDITRATNAAREAVPSFGDLDSARQAALISMAFQMGRGGLQGFKSMISAIEAKDWPRARLECLHSRFAKQTPNRANEIGEMILTGKWPDGV